MKYKKCFGLLKYMVKLLYKRIIRKLGLSGAELKELKTRLIPENICKGPFVQGDKNCPNTTALAVKRGVAKFGTSDEVKRLMKEYGVKDIELWLFYVAFDLLAMLSDGYFRKSLRNMREAIDELISEQGI